MKILTLNIRHRTFYIAEELALEALEWQESYLRCPKPIPPRLKALVREWTAIREQMNNRKNKPT
jgi:hypothetical protein